MSLKSYTVLKVHPLMFKLVREKAEKVVLSSMDV